MAALGRTAQHTPGGYGDARSLNHDPDMPGRPIAPRTRTPIPRDRELRPRNCDSSCGRSATLANCRPQVMRRPSRKVRPGSALGVPGALPGIAAHDGRHGDTVQHDGRGHGGQGDGDEGLGQGTRQAVIERVDQVIIGSRCLGCRTRRSGPSGSGQRAPSANPARPRAGAAPGLTPR